MATLTGGKLCAVKRERILVGELGILPFVVSGKGSNELILVQRIRQIGFVARSAKFRSPIETTA